MKNHLYKLEAIWLRLDNGPRKRIAQGDLVAVQRGKIIRNTDPSFNTHRIVSLYGTEKDTEHEINLQHLMTKDLSTIRL